MRQIIDHVDDAVPMPVVPMLLDPSMVATDAGGVAVAGGLLLSS